MGKMSFSHSFSRFFEDFIRPMKFLNKITLIGFTLNPEHTPGIKRIPIYD
jgi:hypothetical protein